MKNTFDNRKLQKIQNLNFDLKALGEGILRYLNKKYMHRKYTIHEYQKIERSITINKAKGNIKFNSLTNETINETLCVNPSKFELFQKKGANTINLPLRYRLKTWKFSRYQMMKQTS